LCIKPCFSNRNFPVFFPSLPGDFPALLNIDAYIYHMSVITYFIILFGFLSSLEIGTKNGSPTGCGGTFPEELKVGDRPRLDYDRIRQFTLFEQQQR